MNEVLEARQYATTLRKWWWLIILAVVAASAIAYEVSQRQPRIYQASTTLIVGPSILTANPDRSEIEVSQLLAQSYADIARRQPVLQGVIDTLNLDNTWQSLKKQVQVEQVEGTQLLEITVEAGSPDEAQALADEIALHLILQSAAALQDQPEDETRLFVRQQLGTLQANIAAGQARLAELEKMIPAASSTQRDQELQAEMNALEILIADWQKNYIQFLPFTEGQSSPNYLTVVEPAQADPDPVRPRIVLNTVLAGVAGLLLALGVVFLREYLDGTLKSVDDLDQILGLTFLGAIGVIRGKGYRGKLITIREPFSPASEAYRIIRSSIQFTLSDRPVESLLVTSPAPGEGKSVVVANLGVVMAQAGFRTILVDSDLRCPALHQIFDVPNVEGLTDVLCAPENKISRCLRSTRVENLKLIASGVLPLNPSELLSSQCVEQLLASLNEMADVIILDSPPALAVADAAILSTQVDGVVLVIEAGKTHREAARQAILNLQHAGANVLGGVLNRVSGEKWGYGYNYSRALTPQVDHAGRPDQRRWWHLLRRLAVSLRRG